MYGLCADCEACNNAKCMDTDDCMQIADFSRSVEELFDSYAI